MQYGRIEFLRLWNNDINYQKAEIKTFLKIRMYKNDACNSRISEMNVTTPKGMTKSEMLKHSVSNDRWYVNVSWTPTEMDLGNHTICCAAFDSIR